MYRVLLHGVILVGLAALVAACGGGSSLMGPDGPTITGIDPASGGVDGGTHLTIHGTGLANPGVGTNVVLIGGTPAEDIVVVDGTTITCQAPPHAAGPVDVQVTKASGTVTAAGAFTYHPAPTIASITPADGTRLGDVPVTITGSGFQDNDPGETVALIGMKELTGIVVVDDATLTGLTPESYLEIVKDVTVRNDNGQDVLANGYTYTGPRPLLYTVTPNEGYAAGGTHVTLRGEWYTVAAGQHAVVFGDVQAANVTRIDDYMITCTAPFGPPGEWVNVMVSNANGSSTLANAFYYIPPPMPTAVVPATGTMMGGDPVTITGVDFMAAGAGTNTVAFGSTQATSVVTVNDSTITCVTPAGPLGPVDVSVSNMNGTGTLNNGFTYTTPCWWESTYGDSLPMSDDSSANVPISGFSFPFFGTSYSSIYVCSNGSVVFGGSWTSYPNSALAPRPQIAVCQRDLYPPSGGSVHARELSDRVIVTYVGVPPLGGSGTLTAQVHLLKNGVVCILYQSNTVSPSFYVTCSPGTSAGATQVNVDLSAGATGGSADALYQRFGTFDLNGGYLLWQPNAAGGFDVTFHTPIP